ncbi:MAG: hypothetical protein KUG71_03055, partial [Porticoccaceae bacterium]|nr:hypothetical protein [Porticoccaceae bacterium]
GYNTAMDTVHHNKRGQWIFAMLLVVAGLVSYFSYRQQVFEVLASGTQWVLVTCGFVPEGDDNIQSERLRKLYYAARMYNETPAKELSPEDQLAAERYPGMGFGLVHTFDPRPVSAVIGGWLFTIPCTYFIDSRDCNKSPTTVRLKVSIVNFEPISLETIEQFLAVASPEIVRITLSGAESRSNSNGHLGVQHNSYYDYDAPDPENADDQLRCTDTDSANPIKVIDHCLLTFNYSRDTIVELKFDSSHRLEAPEIKGQAQHLVSSFQIRQ